jgi:hypothetical protein
MQEIQHWLNNGRPYGLGVLLYERFAPMVEKPEVVHSVSKLLRMGSHPVKLNKALEKLNAALSDNDTEQAPKAVPIAPKPMQRPLSKKVLVLKDPKHIDNGTVNVRFKHGTEIQKISLLLVERVNGKELVMGACTGDKISYGEFLRMLYSGVYLDLVVCTYNKQRHTGGERVALNAVMSLVHRVWHDPIAQGDADLSFTQQKRLAELKAAWLPWWGELCTTHAQLCVVDDVPKRFAMAERIKYLHAKCRECWVAAAYIRTWGAIPPGFKIPKVKSPSSVADKNGMRLEERMVGINLTKYRSKLQRPIQTEKQRTKWLGKISALQARRNELRRELNLPLIN